jgi:hypothetical protein
MSEVGFINVDLEVSSQTDLRWLVEDFGEDVVNLYSGPSRGHFLATFETGGIGGDPNTIIGHFCHLVESMRPRLRRAWDAAFLKVFDVGYESGAAPKSYQSELRPETVVAVARVGASLRITVYPVSRANRRKRAGATGSKRGAG